jgi:hypothetical protein
MAILAVTYNCYSGCPNAACPEPTRVLRPESLSKATREFLSPDGLRLLAEVVSSQRMTDVARVRLELRGDVLSAWSLELDFSPSLDERYASSGLPQKKQQGKIRATGGAVQCEHERALACVT